MLSQVKLQLYVNPSIFDIQEDYDKDNLHHEVDVRSCPKEGLYLLYL